MFMQYLCKNPKCDAIFLAEDLYDRETPQTWRYCPECEDQGFPIIRDDPNLEFNRQSNKNNLAKYWKRINKSKPSSKQNKGR